jgi:hypothetical protein
MGKEIIESKEIIDGGNSPVIRRGTRFAGTLRNHAENARV